MRRSRIDERTADRLLAGRNHADQSEQGLAQLVAVLKDAADRGVSPKTAEAHITQIAEAARAHAHAGPEEIRTPVTALAGVAHTRRESLMDRSKALMLKLAGSVVAMSMATFGMAYAGVDLPGQAAEQAFSAVGVALPNQDAGDETDESTETDGKSVSEDVRAVIDGTDERGCEFGQAVAAAASQNSQDEEEAGDTEAEEPCTDDESDTDDTDAEAQGSKATGDEKSAEGRATAEEAKTKSSTTPAGSQATGEEKSSGASAGGQATGEEKSAGASAGGQATGEEKSSGASTGGQATGEEKSASGQATGEEKSEGRRP